MLLSGERYRWMDQGLYEKKLKQYHALTESFSDRLMALNQVRARGEHEGSAVPPMNSARIARPSRAICQASFRARKDNSLAAGLSHGAGNKSCRHRPLCALPYRKVSDLGFSYPRSNGLQGLIEEEHPYGGCMPRNREGDYHALLVVTYDSSCSTDCRRHCRASIRTGRTTEVLFCTFMSAPVFDSVVTASGWYCGWPRA
jgi:hypothetical protein